MQSHQPTEIVDLSPIHDAIKHFDPHAALLNSMLTHVHQAKELEFLIALFTTDYKVEAGDSLGEFLYVARPWLTDRSFKIIADNLTHASVVIPVFFKQCKLQDIHDKPEKYREIPDILMTLFYMAKVGVRLDKHNSKIAFINPNLGRAYQICEMNGCVSQPVQPLGMSNFEVFRHLSYDPDLVKSLLELAYIDELLIIMKMSNAGQSFQTDIKSLFACTLDEPEPSSLCLGLFSRRAALPALTLDEQMEQIRVKYAIGEYPQKPPGL